MNKAIFAAGCFWGVQYYFDQVPGVKTSIVGYTGGKTKNPSYEEVCTHTTGHAEALLIEYSEDEISYRDLVRHFFKMHDPTQLDRQGPDVGDSYRTAIFYLDENQKEIADEELKSASVNFKNPIVTEITKATEFYPAEDYHQKFAERTGRGMCHIPYEPLN